MPGGASPIPAASWRRALASPWLLALATAALSWAIRAQVADAQLSANPMLRSPWLDDAAYLEFARALRDGLPRPWFLAPLYPWLLAQAGRGFELGLALACSLNLWLGVAGSVATALAARALGSPAAGWLAGALHAGLGAFVFSDVTPGQEPALCLLHVLALVSAVHFARAGTWPAAGALGLCAGLATLGRATSLGLLLGAWPGLARLRGSARVLALAACLAGTAAALLPAALLNRALNDDPSPLPWGGGVVLYFANGPDSRASVSYLATQLGDQPDQIEQRALELASSASGRALTPREASSWWLAETWRTRDSLGGMLAHLARKAALFFSHEERGSNHAVAVERDYSAWLRALPVSGWWLLAWGPAAWWLQRRRRPEVDAACAMLVGSALLLTLAFPIARYRLPIANVLLVVLAAAVAELGRGHLRARLPGALAIGVALSGLAFAPIREPDDGLARVNLARAHVQLGEVARARSLLAQVLETQPGNGPARETLGRLELAAGRPAEALEHLRQADPDPRSRFGARVAAVFALVELGRASEAQRLAEILLSQRPDDAELLAFAALAAWSASDARAAEAYLARARRLAPDSPAVRGAGQRMVR